MPPIIKILIYILFSPCIKNSKKCFKGVVFVESVKDEHQVTSDSRVAGPRGHSSLSQMEEFS